MRSISLILIGTFLITIASSQSRVGGVQVLGRSPTSEFLISDIWGYEDEETSKQYALMCAGTDGLLVIDVSDPSRPLEVSRVEGVEINAIDIKVWKNYAYAVSDLGSSSGAVIDLSNPLAPVVVGSFPGGHNIFISESGYLYVASPGLSVYDLNNDPVRPSNIYSDTDCVGHDVAVIGDRLYDFAWDCGTRIFDISQPRSMRLLATIPGASSLPVHSGWPSQDGNYLFVTHEHFSPSDIDISVVDISDLSSPLNVGSFTDTDATVHNLYVIDEQAYVSYYRAGMRVFDISDPTDMALLAEYDTDATSSGEGFGGLFGLYTNWGTDMILGSDEDLGLFIFTYAGVTTSTAKKVDADINGFKAYPSPTIDQINVEFQILEKQKVEIIITNTIGEIISRDKFLSTSNKEKRKYYINTLEAGVYFVVLYANKSIQSKKIVVVK